MQASQRIRRILVGVDSKGLCAEAVLQAGRLAESLDAKLDLVHGAKVHSGLLPALSEDQLAGMNAALLVGARKATVDGLKRASDAIGPGLDLEGLLAVHQGSAAKVVLQTAEELEADLIVLGPHAERSLFDFGSTARAVLSSATCPVWNHVGAARPIRSILIPVDFSEHGRCAMEYGRALAEDLGASVRVLHCYSPPEFAYSGDPDEAFGPTYVLEADSASARDELDRHMREVDWGTVPAEASFVEGIATRTLPEEAAKSDRVVMGTHGRTGFSRFLLGSVAYTTVRRSEKPVLVVPRPERSWLMVEHDAG